MNQLIAKRTALFSLILGAMIGLVSLLPPLIGFALFFAVPLLMTIYWSFNDVKTIAGGLDISWCWNSAKCHTALSVALFQQKK